MRSKGYDPMFMIMLYSGGGGQLEYSLRIEISMGLMKKLENGYFLILKFCFHDVTLEADLGR